MAHNLSPSVRYPQIPQNQPRQQSPSIQHRVNGNSGIPNGFHQNYPHNQYLGARTPIQSSVPPKHPHNPPATLSSPGNPPNGQSGYGSRPQGPITPVLSQPMLPAVSLTPHPASTNATNYTSHHLSNSHPSAVTNKRRLYPQQVSPSIPTVQHSTAMNQPSVPSNLRPQTGQSQVMPNLAHQPQQQPNNIQTMPTSAHQPKDVRQTTNMMNRLTVQQQQAHVLNLLEQKQIITPKPTLPPTPPIAAELQKKNANPDILRCTFNAVPQTSSLQKQCKLPFGIHIQPFKENMNIPVITTVITRCRSCRSYLNPFVSIPDHRRWQCNICYRMNDLPEELCYDHGSRQYQNVRKRPELNYASVEFLAPSEYMVRPPQTAIYLFVFDVSFNAVETGYLKHVCELIKENLDALPGDSRKMIGFLTFNSALHFYSLKSSQHQPQMHVMTDIEDVFLPVPDGLLVNVKESKEMILQLLDALPTYFEGEMDTFSATGAAMTAARKMVLSTGGRITLFQTCLPNIGPGKLTPRELASMSHESKATQYLNPSTDFYKKLSLECAGEQVAIDIFLLSSQYADLASLSCASRYSSGAIHYYPDFHDKKNPSMLVKLQHDFKRYLTRSIGFEAVMRLRCTKGLNIHTFHGNFFVRSTDLLSLPNVNPDHSFSMQMEIEDPLVDSSMVAFQAALLYTSINGERRIRVHTLSLPVTAKLSDVYAYADQQAIICSLAKLAVDRTLMSSLGDAREALMNACIDCLKTYRKSVSKNGYNSEGVLAPYHLRLLPMYVLALLKNSAFRLGSGVSLDKRVFSLLEYKWQPLPDTLVNIYPRLYSLMDLAEEHEEGYTGPPLLHASAEKLSRNGIYFMDSCEAFYIFVGRNAPDHAIQCLFNLSNVAALPEVTHRLPVLNNAFNVAVRRFVDLLTQQREFLAPLEIIREDSRHRMLFLNHLIDDRTETSMSYHEFLMHVQRQMND